MTWVTTGIPNIEVLLPLQAGRLELWLEPLLRRALNTQWIRARLSGWIDKRMQTPTDEELNNTSIAVWGEVRNDAGKTHRRARARRTISH